MIQLYSTLLTLLPNLSKRVFYALVFVRTMMLLEAVLNSACSSGRDIHRVENEPVGQPVKIETETETVSVYWTPTDRNRFSNRSTENTQPVEMKVDGLPSRRK